MGMVNPKLPADIEQAAERNHGMTHADGQRLEYIVMSIDVFREADGRRFR